MKNPSDRHPYISYFEDYNLSLTPEKSAPHFGGQMQILAKKTVFIQALPGALEEIS